jgi:hypothetical protein
MKALAKLIVSVVFWCLIFWGFKQIGWITITSDLPPLQVALYACGVSIAVTIVVGLILVIIAAIPCLGSVAIIIASPFITFGTIYLTGQITGLYSTTTIWWQMVLMGLGFSLLRLLDQKSTNPMADLRPLPTPKFDRRPYVEVTHATTGEGGPRNKCDSNGGGISLFSLGNSGNCKYPT